MFGIKLKVWGDYACFTRPEFKVERVSYDVITPSSARGILEAVHWKPSIKWVIDEIEVINPIKISNIRRNEVTAKASVPTKNIIKTGVSETMYLATSQNIAQRATIMLVDVCYVISAHFEMTDKRGETDTPEKHYNQFLRHARKGKCFDQPYFGCREFSANFSLVEENDYYKPILESKDLGYMLYDIDFKNNMTPMFFKADMINGKIIVPNETEVLR